MKTEQQEKRKQLLLNIAAIIIIPIITTFTIEWIVRSEFPQVTWQGMFSIHYRAFILSTLLLTILYLTFLFFSNRHWISTLVVGGIGNVMAIISYFKMQYRGEPFLPWDIVQVSALVGIKDKIELQWHWPIAISLLILLFLVVCTARLKTFQFFKNKKAEIVSRIAAFVTCVFLVFSLVTGVYLNEARLQKMEIWKISWRTSYELNDYGVISTFMQNLQSFVINQPKEYSAKEIEDAYQAVTSNKQAHYIQIEDMDEFLQEPVEKPNIIFIMSEAFWDIRRLDGIEYNQALFPTLMEMQNNAVYGYTLTPSLGGGTCNVEFEVLTGYSMKFLPNGSIPYISYLNTQKPALPEFLKEQGYETMAIHTFQKMFWNRNVVYEQMGFENYYAEEDFLDPELSRGYISDMELSKRIIEELELREQSETPIFIHTVSMQNHTGYDISNYAPEDLIQTSTELDISEKSLGNLQDCATGLQEADAALAYLIDYLSEEDKPTIVVFWGDHLNTVGTGLELQEKTGYNTQDNGAAMHQTPFVIWSNYADISMDMGVVATYNLAPIMMDLYGLEKPEYFEFLLQQLEQTTGASAGYIVNEEGKCVYLSDANEQQVSFMQMHELLQYDLLHGKKYFTNLESSE